MTAAELLLDLAERLDAADRSLKALAWDARWKADDHARLTGKAEGVRLALGYVNELRRMTGEDFT